jgi:membrane protein implicated in regulation of membrane protease activity
MNAEMDRMHARFHTFARYLLFQVPGTLVAAIVLSLLVRWDSLSATTGWVFFGLWVFSEIAMYPILRVAYEPGNGSGGAEALMGLRGVANGPLDPHGWIVIGAERWRAEVASGLPGIAAGAAVRVREVRNLTLIVEPDFSDEEKNLRRRPDG